MRRFSIRGLSSTPNSQPSAPPRKPEAAKHADDYTLADEQRFQRHAVIAPITLRAEAARAPACALTPLPSPAGSLRPRAGSPLEWFLRLREKNLWNFEVRSQLIELDPSLPPIRDLAFYRDPEDLVFSNAEFIAIRESLTKLFLEHPGMSGDHPVYLTAALAKFVDEEGRANVQAAVEHYGPGLQLLLEHVEALPTPEGPVPLHWEMNWLPQQLDETQWPKHLVNALLDEVDRHRPDMPIVRHIAGVPDPSHPKSMFVRSHGIQTMHEMLRLMGVDPATSTIASKLYSTNQATRRLMEREGFRFVDTFPDDDPPGPETRELFAQWRAMHPEPTVSEALTEWISKLPAEGKLYVIDDGAAALLTLAAGPIDIARRVRAVEQTRFGARKLHGELPFPVVNVAESLLKLELESIFIGWSMAQAIHRNLESLVEFNDAADVEYTPRIRRDIAVIGHGAVGTFVARFLREYGYRVVVVEPEREARRKAIAARFPIRNLARALAGCDAFVGTTGSTALEPFHLNYIPHNCVAFSASSSLYELSVRGPHIADTDFWPMCGDEDDRLVAMGYEHGPRILSVPNGDMIGANALYPANFTGGENPVAAEFIELTRALLTLGHRQVDALPDGVTGLIDLDPVGQLEIGEMFLARMRSLPESKLPRVVLAMVEEAYAKVRPLLQENARSAAAHVATTQQPATR